MATLIIFLSDIHIKQEDDFILAHPKDIVDAAFGDFSDTVKCCHVVVTGDIAQSGSSLEYELAEKFFLNISNAVKQRIGENPFFAMCPGNHDCDFSEDQSVRNMLLDGLEPLSMVPSGVSDVLAKPLSAYFSFESKMASGDTLANGWITRYQSSGSLNICYTAMNVALTSGLPERQGRLLFNMDATQNLAHASSNLSIFLLHQPLNWIQADCARALGDYLSTNADIVLLGHEHKDRGQLVTGLYDESQVTFYFADALFDRNGVLPSSFRSVLVDDKARVKSTRLVWQGHNYQRDASKSDSLWRDCSNKEARRNGVAFSSEFVRWIDDIGATYSHRGKERLTLSDIFVWPNLRPVVQEKNSQTLLIDSEEISAAKFFDGLTNCGLVVIRGDEQHGKTTLAKRWLAKLRSGGSYPIYMSGSDIKSVKGAYVDNAVKDIAKRQYECGGDFFHSLEPSERVILLDDFDDLIFNVNGKSELLSCLNGHFGTVVIFVGSNPGIDLWLEKLISESNFSKVVSYEIMQMNYQRRMKLIEKWLHIGNEYRLEDADIEATATRLGRLVTDTLGRNLVPSVPLFILIILQRAESESDLETVIKNGSHGFLYQSLITRAIVEKVPSFTVDTAMTYLSSYARELFVNGADGLSLHDLEKFHVTHCDCYELDYSFERTKSELRGAGVWLEKNGFVSFAYPYLYFFFVAWYLTNLENTARRKEVVTSLVETIHTETSANILLFLAHLGRDSGVLDTLLVHASGVFEGIEEFDLYSASAIFLEFQEDKVREIFYDCSREQGLAIVHDEDVLGDPVEVVSDSGIATIGHVNDQTRRLNTAFRTLQVLGQVLRNHAGSLEGPRKRDIARACTALGLRTLGVMLALLKEVAPDLIYARMQGIIESEKEKSLWRKKQMELVASASAELRELVTNIAVGTFVRIAGAIGSEQLARTLRYILRDTDTKKMVEIAVKLEHFSSFPSDDVLDVAKRNPSARDVFALTLIRRLVIRRFYMFPDSSELKRKVFSALSIERKPFQAKGIRKTVSRKMVSGTEGSPRIS